MNPRIGVDVSDLCTGRADGTTRYTGEIWRGLPNIMPAVDWQWFAPCVPPAENLAGTWHTTPWPRYWTQLRFPFSLIAEQPDLLFMPIQQVPVLRPKGLKIVATVHDIAFHYYPEQFRYKDWALLHLFTAHAVRTADHIVADSRATADDIAREYGRVREVTVVHLGVDHNIFHAPSESDKLSAQQKLAAYNPRLNQPYILFVGQIQPRKNIVRLVDAFAKLHLRHPELSLVLAGSHGWLQEPIRRHILDSPVKDQIIELTDLSDELLPALYWQASVFVLPSLYEGFGLPALEAMACGTPVVVSNVSSLPEVVGEAAVLCDPTDTESIGESLERALNSATDLRPRGLAQAKNFSWPKTLDKLSKVFDQYV